MFNQHSTAQQHTPIPNALKGVDPELITLACHMAHCAPADLMAVAWHDDGSLAVVVQPGPKHIFTAQQIFEARLDHPVPQVVAEQPAPTLGQVAALEHVANAHPGELAAAEHNAPPAPNYTDQYRKAAAELTEAELREAQAKAKDKAEHEDRNAVVAQLGADIETELREAQQAERHEAQAKAEREERQDRQAREQRDAAPTRSGQFNARPADPSRPPKPKKA
jgi:hypothetical protein